MATPLIAEGIRTIEATILSQTLGRQSNEDARFSLGGSVSNK